MPVVLTGSSTFKFLIVGVQSRINSPVTPSVSPTFASVQYPPRRRRSTAISLSWSRVLVISEIKFLISGVQRRIVSPVTRWGCSGAQTCAPGSASESSAFRNLKVDSGAHRRARYQDRHSRRHHARTPVGAGSFVWGDSPASGAFSGVVPAPKVCRPASRFTTAMAPSRAGVAVAGGMTGEGYLTVRNWGVGGPGGSGCLLSDMQRALGG